MAPIIMTTPFRPSPGWDINGFTYSGKSLNLTMAIVGFNPTGIMFKPDGTKVYVLSNSSQAIHQWTLSTPWDISTGTYDVITGAVGSDSNPTGCRWNDDGTYIFVCGDQFNYAFQYDTAGSPQITYDVNGMTTGPDFYTFAEASQPYGIHIKDDDGTKLYVSDLSTNTVYQYNLPVPWTLSGAVSYDSISKSLAPATSLYTVRFSIDGYTLFALDNPTTNRVYQFDMTTPWDITTATYNGVNVNVNAQANDSYDIDFKPDGSIMYVLTSGSGTPTAQTIYQYE